MYILNLDKATTDLKTIANITNKMDDITFMSTMCVLLDEYGAQNNTNSTEMAKIIAELVGSVNEDFGAYSKGGQLND